MLVMGVVATAVLAVGMRAFTDTATITNRRDVFDDARVALDRFSKQLRQGEVVDCQQHRRPLDHVHRLPGRAARDLHVADDRLRGTAMSLEESTDGGANYYTILTATRVAGPVQLHHPR